MARLALRGPTLPALTLFLVMLAACTGDGPSLSLGGTPAASSEAAGPGPAAECPSVDLRLSGGTAPDLSGTWVGIGERNATPWPGVYEFNLLNSCVVAVGRSTEVGEEVGASWMNAIMGKVNPDFTISGDWAVVSTGGIYCRGVAGRESSHRGSECTQARGTLLLRIEEIETAEGNRVRLVLQEYTKIGVAFGGVGGFITGIWVRPGDETLLEVPVD